MYKLLSTTIVFVPSIALCWLLSRLTYRIFQRHGLLWSLDQHHSQSYSYALYNPTYNCWRCWSNHLLCNRKGSKQWKKARSQQCIPKQIKGTTHNRTIARNYIDSMDDFTMGVDKLVIGIVHIASSTHRTFIVFSFSMAFLFSWIISNGLHRCLKSFHFLLQLTDDVVLDFFFILGLSNHSAKLIIAYSNTNYKYQ